MRHFELSTPVHATPDQAWAALVTLADWPDWNALVPQGSGVVEPGRRLEFRIRISARGAAPPRFRPHRPTVLVVDAPRQLVLEASFGARWLVHMVHSFYVIPTQDGCTLRQTWATSGLLVPLLWSRLRAAQEGFAELGEDLAGWMERGSEPA